MAQTTPVIDSVTTSTAVEATLEDSGAGAVAVAPVRPRKSWRRRWRTLLLVAALLYGLYLLFGYFAVPWLVRRTVLTRVQDRIDGQVTLHRVAFDPFRLVLTLEQMQIKDPGGLPLATFERFEGNLELFYSLLHSGTWFRSAQLIQPFVHAQILENGELNLAKLIRPAAEPHEPVATPPRIVIGGVDVLDAKVRFVDNSLPQPFDVTAHGIAFRIDFLDTHPGHENRLELTAALDRGELLTCEASFFLNPLTTRGTLTLKDVHLPRFMPYALGHTEGHVSDGRLSMGLEFEFAPAAEPALAGVSVHDAHITGLKIDQDQNQVLVLPDLQFSKIDADVRARNLNVGQVTLSSAKLDLRRDKTGAWAIMGLVQRNSKEAGQQEALPVAPNDAAQKLPPSSSTETPRSTENPLEQIATATEQLIADALGPWSVNINRLVLSECATRFTDEFAGSSLAVKALRLEAGPIRSDEYYRIPFNLSLTAGQSGRVHLSGHASPMQHKLELKVATEQLDLAFLAPYLPPLDAHSTDSVAFSGATVSLNGDLTTARYDPGGVVVTWSGQTNIKDLKARDIESKPPVGKLQRLNLDGELSARLGSRVDQYVSWDGDLTLNGLNLSLPTVGRTQRDIGQFTAAGKLDVRIPTAGEPVIQYEGTTAVANAKFAARDLGVRSLTVDQARLTGIQWQAHDKTIRAKQLIVANANANGALDVLLSDEPPTPAAEDANASGDAYTITIDRVRLSDSAFELLLEEGDPSSIIVVEKVDFNATDFSTRSEKMAELEFAATLPNTAHEPADVRFRGTLNPFSRRRVEALELSTADLSLDPVANILAPHLGYRIDRGRVSATLAVKVAEGEVRGHLDITLDELHLGEKVQSPDAIDVPIKLALNVLRDGNDRIKARIPISGSLDDPDFSFQGLIAKAFSNQLIKVATAPFQILELALDGEKPTDLSRIAFKAGSAELDRKARSTLKLLARAMNERPFLTLRVIGQFDTVTDGNAMRPALLHDQMLRAVQARKPSLKQLSARRYKAAVKDAYRRQFNTRGRPRDGKKPSFKQMESDLAAAIEIPADRLTNLARMRAHVVADSLVHDRDLESTRITVGRTWRRRSEA